MLWLWVAAAVLSAGAAVLVAQRAAAAARRGDDNRELGVYRRQMAELDALADRGLIAEPEHRSIRAETGRRLLAAAHRPQAALRTTGRGAILIAATLIPLAALGLYVAVGAPAFPDQPFAQRLAHWEQAAASGSEPLDPSQMAAVWRAIAAANPGDPEPLRQLARFELASDQPLEASQALQRAIAISPKRADLWELLGAIDVSAAGGDVGDDAKSAFTQALALNPKSIDARYYLARAKIAGGDAVGGLADWRALAAELPANDPRAPLLASEITQVTATGHLPPPQQTDQGPAQAGGGSVGPAQIQAMVDGLAARLQAHPDDPEGWVRLVRALTVLGDTTRRDAALTEARRRYAGDASELAALDAALKPPQ